MNFLSTWRAHLTALTLYEALSFTLIDHGVSISKNILGVSSDPMAFIWCLAWWPFALLHHLPVLHPDIIWQPVGLDLAWVTSVPFLSLLAMPLTLTTGPVVAYNVLTLLAPALAAFCAYVLCLYLTARPGAAFVGGLIYGFSTYEMSESMAHLNLDFNAAVPCLLLVVLARLDSRLNRPAAAVLFAGLLTIEFYISMEIAATLLLFGGIAWGLALALLPEKRMVIRRLVPDGLLAAAFALVPLAPFLITLICTPRTIFIPAGWSYVTATRLFNMVVTTPSMVFYIPGLNDGSRGFFGMLPQSDFTTGLPIIAISAWFLHAHSRTQAGRLLACLLPIVLVASLGPQLWIGSYFSRVVLPWFIMLHVPLMSGALPARFALYGSLIFAVILALWVAAAHPAASYHRRALVGVFAWLVTVAAPHSVTRAPYDHFFEPGVLQATLGPQPRVLILPPEGADSSTFWQAENHFGFSQTGGYLGMPPATALEYQGVVDIAFHQPAPHFAQDVAKLCLATHTGYVLTGPGTAPAIVAQMNTLSWPRQRIYDVVIYTVPGTNL